MTLHMKLIKTQNYSFSIVLLILSIYSISLVTSCQTAEPNKATSIINKSIEAHGGMEKWKSLDTMIYRKKITLYDKKDSIRKYIEQEHNYSLSTELKGRYSYHDSVKYQVVFDGNSTYKIEGKTKQEPDESAIKSFYSAYYVLNMPWKLLDEGANATYE